jgi:PAS domain S-box-containing protein
MPERPSANLKAKVVQAPTRLVDVPDFIVQASMPIAVIGHEDYLIHFANRKQLSLWNADESSVIGKPVAGMFPNVESTKLEQMLDLVFAGSGIQHCRRARFDLAGEHQRFFDITFEPVVDANGTVHSALMLCMDVTEQVGLDDERVKKEKLLQELELQFHLVIENVPAVVYVFDQSLHIMYMNRYGLENARAVLGNEFDPSWSLPEIVGKVAGKVEYFDVDGNLLEPANYPTFLALNTGRDAEAVVKRVIKNTGEVTWLLNRCSPMFGSDGKVKYVIYTSTDLTAQKKAEEQIRQSKDQLRLVTNGIPALISYIGSDEVYKFGNDRYQDWFGFPAEKIIGMSLTEVLGEEAYRKLEPYFRQVLSGHNVTYEALVPYKAAGTRYVHANYVPHFGANNEVLGFYALITDITERKMAENELIYRKALLEAQNDAIPDAIMVVDTRGQMVSFNQQCVELWNFPPEIIESGDETLALKHARSLMKDPEAFVRKVFHYYAHPFEEAHEELEFIDGRIVERFGKAVVGQDGTNYGWIWFFRDITDKKRSERSLIESESRFRTLAESLPQMIWSANARGDLEYFSAQWLKYSGKTEFTDAWFYMIHPRDQQKVDEIRKAGFASGMPFRAEVRLRNKDGEYRWHHGVAEPVMNENREIIKWVGAFTDIHDQKTWSEKLESLVNERTQELQRSNEDLLQFAHVASHDLKEPIRKILTFGGRLRKEFAPVLPEKANDYLFKMERAAERMFSMVEGVLKYSSVSANEGSFEEVDLNQVVEDIRNDLEVPIRQKHAQFRAEPLPVVKGSPILLHQMFYNLVNNSLKFTKPSITPSVQIWSGTVSVEDLKRAGLAANKAYVKVMVQDNGIGFEPEESERIFSSFTRLNSKDKFEGTGLGLSLCRKIAERHGGAIFADAEMDKGACFTVILPA